MSATSPLGTPIGELLANGDFGSALSYLDGELLNRPTDLAIKLWWIRCQLEVQNLPLSALTTPLEEFFSATDRTPELDRLALANSLILGEKLVGRAQFRIAAAVLERALTLADKPGLTESSEFELIKSTLLGALREELKRLGTRVEKRAAVSDLESKIPLLEMRQPKSPRKTQAPFAAPTPPASRKEGPASQGTTRLSAKTILSQIANEFPAEVINDGRNDLEPDSRPLIDKLSQPFPADPWLKSDGEKLSFTHNLKRGTFLVGGGALMILGAYQLSQLLSLSTLLSSSPHLDEALAMYTEGEVSESLSLPVITLRLSAQEEGSKLDALAVRLTKLGSADITPDTSAVDLAATRAAEPDPLAQPPMSKELPAALSSEATGRVVEAKLPPAKIPSLDPAQMAQNKVEDLGSAALPPGSFGGRTLDGQPVRAFPVERFNPPLIFRTLTATKVLEAPSELAPEVTRLKSEAEVRVVSRVGKWLELQSTGGKRGFIFSQDAAQK